MSTRQTNMKTFTNTKQTKNEALIMMREHERLDHIVQGAYTSWKNGVFKGCLVGCATNGNHAGFEPEFGIPWRIAWLADDIFEGLSVNDAKKFPVKFFETVPEGVDLSRVHDQWCAWMLGDEVDGLTAISKKPSVAVMAALFKRAASGDEPTEKEWNDAAQATEGVQLVLCIWSTEDAKNAWAVWAAQAAWVTRDAQNAQAGWSSRAAKDNRSAWAPQFDRTANNAAAQKIAIKQRDKLLELIRNAS